MKDKFTFQEELLLNIFKDLFCTSKTIRKPLIFYIPFTEV